MNAKWILVPGLVFVLQANAGAQSGFVLPDTLFTFEGDTLTVIASDALRLEQVALETLVLTGEVDDPRWRLVVPRNVPKRWEVRPVDLDAHGIFRLSIKAEWGDSTWEARVPVVVYPRIDPRFPLPLEIFPALSDTARLDLLSAMEDLPADRRLSFRAVPLGDGVQVVLENSLLTVIADPGFSGRMSVRITVVDALGYQASGLLEVRVHHWLRLIPGSLDMNQGTALHLPTSHFVALSTAGATMLRFEPVSVTPSIMEVEVQEDSLFFRAQEETGSAVLVLRAEDPGDETARREVEVIVRIHPATRLIKKEVRLPFGFVGDLPAKEYIRWGDTPARVVFASDSMRVSLGAEVLHIRTPESWFGQRRLPVVIEDERSTQRDTFQVTVSPPDAGIYPEVLSVIQPVRDTLDSDRGEEIVFSRPLSPVIGRSLWLSTDAGHDDTRSITSLFDRDELQANHLNPRRLLDSAARVNIPYWLNVVVVMEEERVAATGWFRVVFSSGIPQVAQLELPAEGEIFIDETPILRAIRAPGDLAVVYEFHLVSADGDTAVRIEAVPLAAIPAYEATVAAEFAALPGGTYRWFVRAIGPTGHYVDSKERIFQLFHAGERAPGADSWATPGWLTFRWSPFPTAPGHVAGTYELVVEHDGVTRTVRTADTAYSLKLSAGRYAWYVRAIADGEVVYAWPTEWVEVGILGRFYCAPCPVRAGDPVRFVWEMLRPQAVEKLVLQVFSCTGELLFEMPVEPERDAYVWDRTVAGGKLLGPAVARLAGESRDGKRLEAFCKLAIYP